MLSPQHHPTTIFVLNRRLIRNRHHSLHPQFRIDRPLQPWTQRLPLQKHVDALSLRLLLLARVVFYSIDEFLSRSGEGDVLDAHVNSLFDVAIADTLVDDHADGGFGDVVDDASFAVVDFVRHTVLRVNILFRRPEVCSMAREGFGVVRTPFGLLRWL